MIDMIIGSHRCTWGAGRLTGQVELDVESASGVWPRDEVRSVGVGDGTHDGEAEPVTARPAAADGPPTMEQVL